MLRIIVQENADGSLVRLSGRLADEFVAEAKRVCFSAVAPLLIDATELQDAGRRACVARKAHERKSAG